MRAGTRTARSGAGADVLIELDRLGSHHPAAERAALRRLLRIGTAGTLALRKAARTHRNAHARYTALLALARLTERRASAVLIRALDDPATPVRQHALMALHHFAWTAAAAAHVARALDDESPGVRHFAAVIAGRRQVRRAVPSLVATLRDPVWHVRQQAAIALGEIGDRRAVAALRRATLDTRPAVRLAARKALGAAPTPGGVSTEGPGSG